MSKRRDPSPDARTVIPGQRVTYHNEPKVPDRTPIKIGRVIKDPKAKKHQRVIRMTIALPVSVELVVGTNEENPDADSDWEILATRNARCGDVSPRIVSEAMHEMDFAAMAAQAANAKDEA
jgi:hypothetical protein